MQTDNYDERAMAPCCICSAPLFYAVDDIDDYGEKTTRIVEGGECTLCGENTCAKCLRDVLKRSVEVVNGNVVYLSVLKPHCSCCAVAIAIDGGQRLAREAHGYFCDASSANNKLDLGRLTLGMAIQQMTEALESLDTPKEIS